MKFSARTRFIAFSISLIASVFWLYIVPPARARSSDDTLAIGSILILSGEGASWGTASLNGMTMAINKLNADGGLLGKRVVSIHQDDRGDPKSAVAAFHELVDVNNVKFIIGPNWSHSGLPLVDMATKNKVIIISPTLGMAKFNESSQFLFNTWPHDSISSEKLADYVFSKGHRNVALVGAEDPWVKEQAESFRNRFESLGGKIAFTAEPVPGTTDMRTETLKISKLSNIDAFVSTTDGIIIGSLVAKALKELQFKIPTYSVTLDQAAIDAAQSGFEGMEFLSFLTPRQDFKDEYQLKFSTPIDIGADSAYDAVMLLASAIRATGSTDPEVVARKLATVKEYDGVSGHLMSDGRRGFTKAFALKRVVDGKPVDLNSRK